MTVLRQRAEKLPASSYTIYYFMTVAAIGVILFPNLQAHSFNSSKLPYNLRSETYGRSVNDVIVVASPRDI